MSRLINFLDNKEELGILEYQLRHWVNLRPRSNNEIELVEKIEREIVERGFFIDESRLINSIQYHDLPGVSSSGFRNYLSDTKLYEYHLKNWKEKKYKTHFQIGQAIHAALTGTGNVISESERQKKNKFLHSFELEAVRLAKENIYLLKDKDFEFVESWINTCNSSNLIKGIFKNKKSLYEVPFFCLCKETGLLLKFTPDILDTDNRVIVDIKTSQDFMSWERTVDRYSYDIQNAFYLWVAECIWGEGAIKDFLFLYLSKVPPFRVSPKAISKARIEDSKFRVIEGLYKLKNSMKNDSWGSLVSSEIEYAE